MLSGHLSAMRRKRFAEMAELLDGCSSHVVFVGDVREEKERELQRDRERGVCRRRRRWLLLCPLLRDRLDWFFIEFVVVEFELLLLLQVVFEFDCDEFELGDGSWRWSAMFPRGMLKTLEPPHWASFEPSQ